MTSNDRDLMSILYLFDPHVPSRTGICFCSATSHIFKTSMTTIMDGKPAINYWACKALSGMAVGDTAQGGARNMES